MLRLADIQKAQQVQFRWRPFDVRHVMIEQDNIPFNGEPIKTAHMWRDIERRAFWNGLSPKLPAPYPLRGLVLANQVAVLGVEEGWVEDYTRATYKRWFEEGHPAGEDPNLSESLKEIGCDPVSTLATAQSDRIAEALKKETEEAMALGVFGSPTFVVDGEVFWGDDRLDDAIGWAKGNRLP